MARSLNKAKKTKKEGRNSMAENIVFQILRSHLMEGELTPGTPIAIRVDQTLGHDLTGIMAGQTFLAVGADRVQTEASVFYCDHNTLCVSGENADDHLFLKTAAATAVTGHITDPRDLMDVSVLAKIQEPEAYIIDDSSLIAPEETADCHAVEVIKGPNISELPMRGPVRETIDAGIVLKLGDNITTDDIIPAGASILKYLLLYRSGLCGPGPPHGAQRHRGRGELRTGFQPGACGHAANVPGCGGGHRQILCTDP